MAIEDMIVKWIYPWSCPQLVYPKPPEREVAWKRRHLVESCIRQIEHLTMGNHFWPWHPSNEFNGAFQQYHMFNPKVYVLAGTEAANKELLSIWGAINNPKFWPEAEDRKQLIDRFNECVEWSHNHDECWPRESRMVRSWSGKRRWEYHNAQRTISASGSPVAPLTQSGPPVL